MALNQPREVGGAKAAQLGIVHAPDMESAVAAAAAEYRVPARRILVRPIWSEAMRERRHLRRGEIIGERVDKPDATEAEHFLKCPACGGYVDIRDLAQVFEHEGPLPHPGQDGVQ